MKQMPLVTTVAINATASFPPARRVQTDADAMVLGTTAASSRPTKRSPVSRFDSRQAMRGMRAMFRKLDRQAAPGRRTTRQTASIGSGRAIKNNRVATIALRR